MEENKQEREEKLQAPEKVVVKNKFTVWLENFWYHHKWGVIVVSFFVIVFAVCFSQCSSAPSADLKIVFAGGYTLNETERKSIVDVFETIAPKNEEGKSLSVLLNDFSVYSEDEMKALATDEDGNVSTYAYSNMKNNSANNLNLFGTYVMAGESCIWLVNETVYQEKNLKKLACPLSELFDEVPENAYDECAFYLSDTALYQTYDALKVLPEDTLIVFSQRLYINPNFSDESYQESLSMYRAIVDFKK